MTAPTLASTTLTSLTVQQLPPTLDGDSEVTRYILYTKAEYENTYSQVYAGQSLSYQVQLLSTGFNYRFKVRSDNAEGFSALSAASSNFITALAPTVPLNLDLEGRTATSITIQWDQPLSNGGIPLLGFKIYMAIGRLTTHS